MKKIIKKIGNSVGITFTKEEQHIYEIKVGEVFDVELSPYEKDNNNRRD